MRRLDDHHRASYCWDGVLLGFGKFFYGQSFADMHLTLVTCDFMTTWNGIRRTGGQFQTYYDSIHLRSTS